MELGCQGPRARSFVRLRRERAKLARRTDGRIPGAEESSERRRLPISVKQSKVKDPYARENSPYWQMETVVVAHFAQRSCHGGSGHARHVSGTRRARLPVRSGVARCCRHASWHPASSIQKPDSGLSDCDIFKRHAPPEDISAETLNGCLVHGGPCRLDGRHLRSSAAQASPAGAWFSRPAYAGTAPRRRVAPRRPDSTTTGGYR